MNAVGIDVSSRKSTVAVLRPLGEVVCLPFDVTHDMLTKDFFKKIIVRMDIPHHFYDDNGIFHCSLIDLLLERVELF